MLEIIKLYGTATAGLYAEVISQIYDSIDKRIRESVSNAYDAHATWVKIAIHTHRAEPNRISIYDNGYGMSTEDLRDKYVSMGGGDNYNNRETIGRIGIGALAIFALGDKITIKTRKKGTENVITAQLNLSAIKSPEEHSTPLDRISLGHVTEQRSSSETDPEHFTEIIIENLSSATRSIFSSLDQTQELISTLERILPIPYRSDDPLFSHITTELKESFIDNNRYVIDVILHAPHLEIINMKLCRRTVYCADGVNIEQLIPLYPFRRFEKATNRDLCLYGYLYINKGEQLPREWQGINTRVKNVTIERNTFFGVEGDAPARVRIGGELFIDNLDENNAIQSNRSGFAVENTDYRVIAEYMEGYILKAIAIVRKISQIDSLVKKIVGHISKIRDMCSDSSEIEDEKEGADSFQSLDDKSVSIESVRRYSLEEKLKSEIMAEFDINPDIVWAPVLAGLYYIEREDDDFFTIQVHDDLRKFEFDIAGNTVEYIIGHVGPDKPVIIKKERNIYFNLDNSILADRDITKLDVGFLQVMLVLYLNYLRSNGNAEQLYRKAVLDLSNL